MSPTNMVRVIAYDRNVLSTPEIKGAISHMLNQTIRQIKADVEMTTSTWDKAEHDPQFQAKVRYAGGNAMAIITTDDDIYRFLNFGTAIRYATMETGFVPKTQPGEIVPGPGRGKMAFISRKYPHPGIEARNWTGVIGDKWEDEIRLRLNAAILRGAIKSRFKHSP